MGRSTSTSCFKIITCGSDSADNNDLDVSESKDSNDKRGWSFRKRSVRHRVLSNTVISETPPSVKKEIPESAELNFQPPNNSTVPEKISIVQFTDEKPQLSTPTDLNTPDIPEKVSVVQFTNEKPQLSAPENAPENLKVPETIVPDDTESKPDSDLDESVVIVIQGAVRGFLAQRELLKLKNVIKLQAAVRGHLVRRHAVGTLRCVQAIVKMQVLVRTRLARLSQNSSFTENKVDGKDEKDDHSSKTAENSETNANVTYSSIEKLLSNRFARQLMESTPKTEPIRIKCDPAKQDSAWNWLERWMTVSYAKQSVKPESVAEQPEKENYETFGSPVETRIPSEVSCDSADSKSSVKETDVTSESEENLITYETDKFNFQPCQPTSSYLDDSEPFQSEYTSLSDVKENSVEITSHQNLITPSDAVPETEPNSIPSNPETEPEQPKRSMKRFASENLEAEGKRYGFGSRNTSNQTFIAAQSKFEDLSLTTDSGRSVSSTHQDVPVDSNVDTVSSGTNALTRTKDPSIAEYSLPHYLRNVHGAGSECGTELSISSTLDSPDRFEVETVEFEHEAKVSEKEICNPDNTNNLDVKADDAASSNQVCDVADTVVDQSEKVDVVQGESIDSVVVTDSPQVEHKQESNASDLHKESDSETRRQSYRSLSPEASPRSHITVPESQGTPSSQVSIKAKKNKNEKSGSSRKRKPLSAGKGSPSNPSHDSGARSSMEQLPRDHKDGKRRNSFGSTKTDNNIDQEPGDSSSSSSIPHFMQATESARAKIQANNSPRSSPDVQDRDIYIKKRHSLPVANGRQGSPRIQRSISQAQPGVKGNGTQPLPERKWQR
ncbi:hypothetical protein Ddye_007221 [Dipteronia dyeriana]|uniref:DUF4005 domain-containing protein n=1 Tax=Dipteronia dyeriana TaxID=168575 RepID=A0AAE0CRX9_9ROSI|nr:hypothetical protein Ddye_007221 [Dipteronia dyeriana]